MALVSENPPAPRPLGLRARLLKLAASPRFQAWAAGMPVIRRIARRDGQALFDVVQGFVSSQVLFALVQLNLPERLLDGPLSATDMAQGSGIPPERMVRLAQAGVALGLLRRSRDLYGLTVRGAALVGVPGLQQMIRHHDVLYRDLSDPVAFLRGETSPELAQFWPYVFGAAGAVDPQVTATYSDLMAQSQGLVAQDTLKTVSLAGVSRLVDIGGGSGAFAEAALRATSDLTVTLYDLPPVIEAAKRRLAGSDMRDRITLAQGSFRDDPLPDGADAVSLIRVLYDHEDSTVTALLRKIRAYLPRGGRLLISEPMSGGDSPDAAGDVYFAFYCMAMGTGTVRSQARIAEMLRDAGFDDIRTPRPARSFVTSVITARCL